MVVINYSLPTVSVIIPCYNCSNIIGQAISSVLHQTYDQLEVIIVDDGSTDADALTRVIADFSDPRLRLVRHSKNLYQPAASNTGIRVAKGELIAFLDSDDEWLPSKLDKQVRLWKSLAKENVLVYSQSDVRTKMKKSASIKIWPQQSIDDGESVGDYLFLNRGFLQTSSILISHSAALAVQFDEAIRKHTDYNLLLRLEAAGVEFAMVEEPLVIVHWEDLHATSRGQSPARSIQFFNTYQRYLSPKAANAFCLQHIIYRQMRLGNRIRALRLLYRYTNPRYMSLLDVVKLASLLFFRDERIATTIAEMKS